MSTSTLLEYGGPLFISGELYAIYILQEYQRKGIGKELINAIIGDFKQQGLNSMLVWVLSNNPSRIFYESLKPKKLDMKAIQIGEETHQEVAFGWKDLSLLQNFLVT
jgi:ribosomal protein S18 acetylase RimI-like enzyme